ncbi:MAG: hypothetical protein RLZZ399_758 [Verrucomicrobiota bacterium]|jgi:hypothetical protein
MKELPQENRRLRSPHFWILFGLLSLACLGFSVWGFPQAFSIFNLHVSMDRASALNAARVLAQKQGWELPGFREVALFESDRDVKNFVELEAGGKEAFARMLREGLFFPYRWRIRHFVPGQERERTVWFTPDGLPYGFSETISEKEAGAALSVEEARKLAEEGARSPWNVRLEDWRLVEHSEEKRVGGRLDHWFTYERPGLKLGEGTYRLNLEVSGDRLTAVSHFIKIPESFERRYEEMRSANETLASFAGSAIQLVYMGGALVSLGILGRKRWLIWRIPLVAAGLVGGLELIASLSQWPLQWLSYSTGTPVQSFVADHLISELNAAFGNTLTLAISFMAAEGLTRLAFPHHLQLWRLASDPLSSTRSVFGRTLGGYWMVGLHLAYVIAFYLGATRLLGWWSPADSMADPNVLSGYLPFLNPIASALHAGFWEECLFRALPLATGVLIGRKIGWPKVSLVIAMIVQALIFATAHANYPSFPAYSRVVELLAPSLFWGWVYLRFGLLPVALSHFVYDAVLMSMPLFATAGQGMWMQRVPCVFLIGLPLWIVAYARIRKGRWMEVPDELRNGGWRANQKLPAEAPEQAADSPQEIRSSTFRLCAVIGVLCAGVWIALKPFQTDEPKLKVSRREAEKVARAFLESRQIHLGNEWISRTSLRNGDRGGNATELVWSEGGKALWFSLLMHRYLGEPSWSVDFVRFEGDVAERAERYSVGVTGDGKPVGLSHALPEARPGASLEVTAAREIALRELQNETGLAAEQVEEISASPSELQARRDWIFTFKDKAFTLPKDAQARIEVRLSGDQLERISRHVYVPHEWIRMKEQIRAKVRTLRSAANLVPFLLIVTGFCVAVRAWAQHRFSRSFFWRCLLLQAGVDGLLFFNGWPKTLASFRTSEPFGNQLLQACLQQLGEGLSMAVLALMLSALYGGAHRPSPRTNSRNLFLGLSLGLVWIAVSEMQGWFEKSHFPAWSNYSAGNTWWPALDGIGAITEVIGQSAVFGMVSFVALKISRRGRHGGWVASVFVFGIGLALSLSNGSSETCAAAVLHSALFASMLTLAHGYVFARQPE